ncbi:MAG: sulfur carrier protein ThiS adenylyltransferase ThiF [Spirochaetia bacterium]|nr:sulfur carrier protein ThiS adenylyltransferase ThiF [Spirochaetia bacterium]
MRKSEAVIGIAGCGGIGGNTAMLLVRSGFRRFVLADFDTVGESNLNRQFFFHDQLGQPKTGALAENLRRIEPSLQLSLYNEKLTPQRAREIFAGCTVLAEGFDNKEAKRWFAETFLPDGRFAVGANGIGGLSTESVARTVIGGRLVLFGDGSSDTDRQPPRGPKVMMIAALMANEILKRFEKE